MSPTNLLKNLIFHRFFTLSRSYLFTFCPYSRSYLFTFAHTAAITTKGYLCYWVYLIKINQLSQISEIWWGFPEIGEQQAFLSVKSQRFSKDFQKLEMLAAATNSTYKCIQHKLNNLGSFLEEKSWGDIGS